jgi:hypothetical protein
VLTLAGSFGLFFTLFLLFLRFLPMVAMAEVKVIMPRRTIRCIDEQDATGEPTVWGLLAEFATPHDLVALPSGARRRIHEVGRAHAVSRPRAGRCDGHPHDAAADSGFLAGATGTAGAS